MNKTTIKKKRNRGKNNRFKKEERKGKKEKLKEKGKLK